MNAKSERPGARLLRIKIVSRVFRYFVLANLIFNAGFWVLFSSPSMVGVSGMTARGLLLCASGLLMFFWFWKLAQLFRFYERGEIFSAETIRCIKVLGLVCLTGWLLLAAVHFMPRPEFVPPNLPAGAQTVKVQMHTYRMGFLSFDFGTGIDFGPLFVGVSVVLAAWIMEEGRKMQEEQELTV